MKQLVEYCFVFFTMAAFSIRQKRWDDDDPSLPNTHAQEALVQPFDEVALPQVRVIG